MTISTGSFPNILVYCSYVWHFNST